MYRRFMFMKKIVPRGLSDPAPGLYTMYMYEGKSKITCTFVVTSTFVDKFSKNIYCD